MAAYWAIVVGGGAAVGLAYGVLLSPTVGVIVGVAFELLDAAQAAPLARVPDRAG